MLLTITIGVAKAQPLTLVKDINTPQIANLRAAIVYPVGNKLYYSDGSANGTRNFYTGAADATISASSSYAFSDQNQIFYYFVERTPTSAKLLRYNKARVEVLTQGATITDLTEGFGVVRYIVNGNHPRNFFGNVFTATSEGQNWLYLFDANDPKRLLSAPIGTELKALSFFNDNSQYGQFKQFVVYSEKTGAASKIYAAQVDTPSVKRLLYSSTDGDITFNPNSIPTFTQVRSNGTRDIWQVINYASAELLVPNASLDNTFVGLRIAAGDDGKLWRLDYLNNRYTRALIKDFGAAKLQIQGNVSTSTPIVSRSELIVTSTLNGNTTTQSLDLAPTSPSNIRDVSTIILPANEYSSNPNSFLEVNGKILFKATDGERGEEVWRTDGTTAGTALFKELEEGVISSFGSKSFVENGFAYYASSNLSNTQSRYWKTDGTTIDSIRSTTAEYQTIKNKFNQGLTYPALTVGNVKYQTYYNAYSLCSRCPSAFNGGIQRILGTDTSFVFSFNYVSCGASAINSLQTLGNKIFFTFHQELAGSNCDKRGALWISDGTAAGTAIVKTFTERPSDIVVANNKLYFTAKDGVNGLALFSSDGTTAGTRVVTNFVASPALDADMDVQKLYLQGNSLYFILANRFNGTQSSLWAYNLDGNAVVKITNLSEAFSGNNSQSIVYNGQLLLAQTTNDVGTELFKIPLTEAPLGTPLSNVSDLSLTQTISPTRTPDTLFLDVAITLKNNGSQTANNVKTTFPSLGVFGLNFIGFSRDTMLSTGFLTDNYSTWFIPSLSVNQSATFTYRLAVPKERIFKTILRTTVKSDQFDGNSANNVAEYPLELTAPCTAPISGSLLVDYYNNQVTDASPIVIQNPNAPSGSYLTNGAISYSFSDRYIRRARGYIKPSESGNYRFYIAGDDNVDVYLSTDDNPANKQRIAYVQGFTGLGEFTKFPSQTSALVNLTAGRRYYVEIVNADKFGDDFFNLQWTTPSVSARNSIAVEQIESFCGDPIVVNLPDLTLENLRLGSLTFQQGQTLTGEVQINNGGLARASAFNTVFFLSRDNIASIEDLQGVYSTESFLDATTATNRIGRISIPSNFPIGQYYLILKVDPNNQIAESNEDNNTLIATNLITITAAPNTGNYCASKGTAPWEYAISNVTLNTLNNNSDKFKDFNTLGYSDFTNLNTTLTKGQTYPLSITPLLSWIGNLPNTYCRVWIDFNQNKTFEANELVLEKTNANPLTQNVLIPTTALTGSTRMRVSLKNGAYPTACEAFEKGEVEDYTVNIQNGVVNNLPDLTLTNLTIPTLTAQQGTDLTAFVDIRNIGLGDSPDFIVRSYISRDSILSNDDVQQSIPPSSGFSAGSAYPQFSFPVAIPSTLPVGQYFLIMKTDPDNQVAESNENNNVVVSRNTFAVTNQTANLPDLTLANLSPRDPSVSQGQNVNFTFDAKNNGTAAAANAFTIKSYLSTDQTLDANDYQNGSIPTANYAAGANVSQIQGALNVSITLAVGNYYLILKIDADNQITESNEANNVLVSTNTIAITAVSTTTYCASKGVAPWEYAISNVTFGTLNNTSDKFKDINTLGYCDYTNLSTTLTKGQTYPLSITPLLSWIGNLPNAYCRVWIDFNQNKTFEANEIVFGKTNANPLTANVLIPTTALTGATRMRVSLKNGSYPTACETFEKGEVEDYTVNISGGSVALSPDLVITNITVDLVLNPANNTEYLATPKITFKNIGSAAVTGTTSIPNFIWLSQNPNDTVFSSTYASSTFGLPPTLAVGASTTITSPTFGVQVVHCSKSLYWQAAANVAVGNIRYVSESNFANNFLGGVAFVCPTTSANDIALTLTSTPSVYRQYSTQNFRISAKNSGNQAFTNVKIKFSRPALTVNGETKVASIGTFQDYCPSNVECSEWSIPTLAGGTTATLDVPIYVLNPTGGITASATLLSSNPVDINVANNTATITINRSNTPLVQPLIQSKPTQLIPVIIQKIAPTITENYIVVELESIVEKAIDFQILNALGNVVLTEKIKIDKGNNKFDFDVSQLPKGMYFIQTSVGKG